MATLRPCSASRNLFVIFSIIYMIICFWNKCMYLTFWWSVKKCVYWLQTALKYQVYSIQRYFHYMSNKRGRNWKVLLTFVMDFQITNFLIIKLRFSVGTYRMARIFISKLIYSKSHCLKFDFYLYFLSLTLDKSKVNTQKLSV